MAAKTFGHRVPQHNGGVGMIYRELGRTGIRVSVVGFGGMRFFNQDEADAIALVRRSHELGITLFETGCHYGGGKSEEWLGKGLKPVRDRVVLANKATACDQPTGKQIRESLEASLKREQTDHFDLFSFWGVNTPDMHASLFVPDGPLDAVMKAKEQGLVRAVGITTHAQPDEIVGFVREHPWDAVTLKYNLLTRRMEPTLEFLGNNGVGVIVMSPLAGGMVAQPGDAIRQELAAHGITPAVLGLRYLTSNPAVSSAISGMTAIGDVEENVAAGAEEMPLSPVEAEMVALIQKRLAGLGDQFCTGCEYCQPCPEGVGIANILKLWNMMRGYGAAEYPKLEYLKMREQRHWADYRGKSVDDCAECGECEDKCPEKLPIREDLKQAHADLTADDQEPKR